MKAQLLLVSLFALAACGGQGTTDDAASDNAATEKTAETTEADETAADDRDATSSEEASSDTAEADEQGAEPLPADQKTATNTIPIAYHGVWDAVTGSCSPESDMRLDIGASQLGFYESVGTVTAVENRGDSIKVSVSMEGEGEKWEDSYIFVLEGERLNTLLVGTNTGTERKHCS